MTRLSPISARPAFASKEDAVAALRRLRTLARVSGRLPSIREEGVLVREVVTALAAYFEGARQVRMFLADADGVHAHGCEIIGGGAVAQMDTAGLDALAPAHRDLFLAPLALPGDVHRGTVLSAPLIEGTSLLGVVLVEGPPGVALGAAELETLAGMAAQCSMAVQHLRATGRTHARGALERDFEVARRIQRSFLAEIPERVDGFRLAASYKPAFHVGGDFYDVAPAGSGCLVATIGDVSGKGVSGALLMAFAAAELRRITELATRPARVLGELDRALRGRICDDTFITACCVRIDRVRRELTVANAGHVLPVLRRRSGEVTSFGNPSGPPLAMLESVEYANETIAFEPGDIVLLMTDGILDALHTDDNPLGLAALEELVRRMPPDIVDINRRILAAVEARAGVRVDDITLLAVELTAE